MGSQNPSIPFSHLVQQVYSRPGCTLWRQARLLGFGGAAARPRGLFLFTLALLHRIGVVAYLQLHLLWGSVKQGVGLDTSWFHSTALPENVHSFHTPPVSLVRKWFVLLRRELGIS